MDHVTRKNYKRLFRALKEENAFQEYADEMLAHYKRTYGTGRKRLLHEYGGEVFPKSMLRYCSFGFSYTKEGWGFWNEIAERLGQYWYE